MLLHDIAHRDGALLSFFCVLASSLGLPVPSLPILAVIGAVMTAPAAVGTGQPLRLLPVLGLAVVGGLAGDLAWFLAGRRFGDRTLQTLCRISLSRDTCIKKTERLFGRFGVRMLVVAKFVPGLSLVCVPLAGAMGVRGRVFAAHDAVGLTVWASAALALGAACSAQIEPVVAALSGVGEGAGAVAVAALAAYAACRHVRRRSLLRTLQAERISVVQLLELMQGPRAPTVLDIRSPERRTLDPFRIGGSVIADERDLQAIVDKVPADRKVVIYCSCPNEVSAAWLSRALSVRGFRDVVPLAGGIDAWRRAGHPLEPIPAAGVGAASS